MLIVECVLRVPESHFCIKSLAPRPMSHQFDVYPTITIVVCKGPIILRKILSDYFEPPVLIVLKENKSSKKISNKEFCNIAVCF